MAVNVAGTYTKPGTRKPLFKSIMTRSTHGTEAGKWSARKAQLLAKTFKARGEAMEANPQSAAQFENVGQTKLAHKKRQKKLRYWRKIFARGCNKISVERRIRSHNGGKEAR